MVFLGSEERTALTELVEKKKDVKFGSGKKKRTVCPCSPGTQNRPGENSKKGRRRGCDPKQHLVRGGREEPCFKIEGSTLLP